MTLACSYNRAVRSAFDQLGGAVAAVKLVGTDFYPCKNSLDGVKHEPSIDSMDCHHCNFALFMHRRM